MSQARSPPRRGSQAREPPSRASARASRALSTAWRGRSALDPGGHSPRGPRASSQPLSSHQVALAPASCRQAVGRSCAQRVATQRPVPPSMAAHPACVGGWGDQRSMQRPEEVIQLATHYVHCTPFAPPNPPL